MRGWFTFVLEGKLAGASRPGMLRPLAEDLTELKAAGIGAVVSLTETPLEAKELSAHDLESIHLPVPEFTPPAPGQIDRFIEFADGNLADGRAVMVHCGAGLGRTGTMLACYLVHRGWAAAAAIRRVREARPFSVETLDQEAAVFAFEEAHRRS